jgi:hypothetical protein
MGLRFRRTVGLIPGVRLNVGLKGLSFSVGERGAHTTIGAKGARTTVGLPGTGLSWTEYAPYRQFPAILGGLIARFRSHPVLATMLVAGAVLVLLLVLMK